jgi:serine/threonine-protein kinase
VLLLVVLIPAGIWLASNSDDDAPAATDTRTLDTTEQSTTTSTTPAAPAAKAVPDVTGQMLADARELLESANFRVRFRRTASDQPRNDVLSQSPKPGAEAEPGSVIVLTVSGGAERVTVPDLGGMTASEAIEALRGAGLDSRTRVVPSEEGRGTVIDQSPDAGEEVAKSTVVVLQIAKAPASPPPSEPATVRVPNVVGLKAADARSRLRALGLRSTQRPEESPRPAGTVVSQSPGRGAELREGGTVTLGVSTGPAQVAIPDVVGLNESAAILALEAAGFVAQVVDEPTGEPTEDGVVLDQSPSAGASRPKGSTVTITVARFS